MSNKTLNELCKLLVASEKAHEAYIEADNEIDQAYKTYLEAHRAYQKAFQKAYNNALEGK